MMAEACRGFMALWLCCVVAVPLVMAFGRQLPFVVVLTRDHQREILVGISVGGVAEFVTLLAGGLWS